MKSLTFCSSFSKSASMQGSWQPWSARGCRLEQLWHSGQCRVSPLCQPDAKGPQQGGSDLEPVLQLLCWKMPSLQSSINFIQGLPPGEGQESPPHVTSWWAGAANLYQESRTAKADSALLCTSRGQLWSAKQPLPVPPIRVVQSLFSKETNVSFAFPFPTSGTRNKSLMAITQTVHHTALLKCLFVCFTIKIPWKSTVAQVTLQVTVSAKWRGTGKA